MVLSLVLQPGDERISGVSDLKNDILVLRRWMPCWLASAVIDRIDLGLLAQAMIQARNGKRSNQRVERASLLN